MNQIKLFNDFSIVNKQLPISAKGLPLITYSITLEAWRRGIEVSLYSVAAKNRQSTYYTLKHNDKEYNFRLSFGGLMKQSARKIVNDKAVTKNYLEEAGVSVPKGKNLRLKSELQEIIDYATVIGYPVVAKPLDARNASGVFTNLRNEEELVSALKSLRDKLDVTEVILEQYVQGEDTRVYVIENQVIAAYIRRPANVIGDGKSNIKDLIDEKNDIRQNNPHLKKFNIEVNDKLLAHIHKNNLSLESVPQNGRRIYLNESTLHPDGCETVDVTDELSGNIKKLAVNALKAVPGMRVSGIDIMVDKERDEGFVLELNGAPNICGHIYPMEGQARNVPKALIDYHFPETMDKDSGKFKYFNFNLDDISKILKSGSVKRVTLPPLPKGTLISKSFLITGHDNTLKKYIHRTAVRLLLGGKIVKKKSGKIIVKVAGEEGKVEQFTEKLTAKNSSTVIIKLVDEDNWNGLYPYYFASISTENFKDSSQLIKVKEENSNLKKELDRLKKVEQEKLILIKELKDIKNSQSWKLTSPLRNIKSKLKNES